MTRKAAGIVLGGLAAAAAGAVAKGGGAHAAVTIPYNRGLKLAASAPTATRPAGDAAALGEPRMAA